MPHNPDSSRLTHQSVFVGFFFAFFVYFDTLTGFYNWCPDVDQDDTMLKQSGAQTAPISAAVGGKQHNVDIGWVSN